MKDLPDIRIATDRAITRDEFVDVLRRSGLAERRPIDDRECMAEMIANAGITVTAWDGDRLVGVARSVTDFSFCCYLSDLAVDRDYQKGGIGKALIDRTRAELKPNCKLILLSAPAATEYYPKLGFTQHPSAWVI